MPEGPYVFEVSPAEAGQKLLQFLTRRMQLPQTLLHRWIRTGQIRLNGGRAKPFVRVAVGDSVRLPPFALSMDASARSGAPEPGQSAVAENAVQRAPVEPRLPAPSRVALPLPPLAYADAELLVFNKPAGLPVHTGTGHTDSLATRLAAQYADAPFLPTPAHRLDKDTSGLLLVAASYAMLRALQDALRDGNLHKEYLAWVEGQWPYEAPVSLRHQLAKRYTGSDERVHVGDGRDAACVALCLRRQPGSREEPTGRSLMHIRLLTGRTHQIRAQMSAEGHPLCGDSKYGGRGGRALQLHALRLVLPDGRVFTVLPSWGGAEAVTEAPPLL